MLDRFRVRHLAIVLRDPEISISHLRYSVRLLREPQIFGFAVLVFARFHDTPKRVLVPISCFGPTW